MLLVAVGCAREGQVPREPVFKRVDGEFTLVSWNLDRYGPADRNGDGRALELKPAAERAAVAGLLARLRPDVLAVQEIGNPAVFAEFVQSLERVGLRYEHSEYVRRGESELHLAVLSRFPIVARHPRVDDRYRIGADEFPVESGILDVEIEPAAGYRFRLLTARLKDKVFHPASQTEMRRNEARLLGNHVRRILRDEPAVNLVVAGDFCDTRDSAPLREIAGERWEHLDDLRPPDLYGAAWTWRNTADDTSERRDYLLVSRGMKPEWVAERSRAVADREAMAASSHRPLAAVFRAAEHP